MVTKALPCILPSLGKGADNPIAPCGSLCEPYRDPTYSCRVAGGGHVKKILHEQVAIGSLPMCGSRWKVVMMRSPFPIGNRVTRAATLCSQPT